VAGALFATAELRRSRGRFGLLMAGAGLLVFVLLFQQALLSAVLDGMTGALERQSGTVLVYAREAQRSFVGSLVLPEQLAAIAEAPGVEDAAELGIASLSYRPAGSGTAVDGERVNVSLIGYQPGRAGTPAGLDEGRMPEAPDEVVATVEDTVAGKYAVGDTVTVEPGGRPLTVVGMVRGARWAISPTLWVPWEGYVETVMAATPDLPQVLASVVAVRPAVQGPGGAAALAADLNRAFPDLEAVTREEAAATAPGLREVRAAFGLVQGLAYLVVAVVVGFFFLSMTLVKEPSVTVLRAVGADASYLVRCLLLQVGVVTAGAMVIGVLFLAVSMPLVRSVVVVELDVVLLARTLGPAVGVALLGALPAVRRTVQVDPATILTRQSLAGPG